MRSTLPGSIEPRHQAVDTWIRTPTSPRSRWSRRERRRGRWSRVSTGWSRGFCLLNNVGIGIAAARDKGVRRIAVIDFDVHHGNGTQHSFQNDAEVFYASTHQSPFYPGTGSAGEHGVENNVVNVPLTSGTGDRLFLGAWEKKIGPALEAFKPELLLVSAGFDAHEDDPLGGLEVTTDGYRQLAQLIQGWAAAHTQGRTVWALEGGYDLRALGDSVVACLESLSS